jgi:hypothetical protein
MTSTFSFGGASTVSVAGSPVAPRPASRYPGECVDQSMPRGLGYRRWSERAFEALHEEIIICMVQVAWLKLMIRRQIPFFREDSTIFPNMPASRKAINEHQTTYRYRSGGAGGLAGGISGTLRRRRGMKTGLQSLVRDDNRGVGGLAAHPPLAGFWSRQPGCKYRSPAFSPCMSRKN